MTKDSDFVATTYGEQRGYQDIAEAAINLSCEWKALDRSAHDWEKLEVLIRKLSEAVDNAFPVGRRYYTDER